MPARISIMTFNVWCSGGKPARWPARQPAIRRLMQTHRPDIVCLQEVKMVQEAGCLPAKQPNVHCVPAGCRTTRTSRQRSSRQSPTTRCKESSAIARLL